MSKAKKTTPKAKAAPEPKFLQQARKYFATRPYTPTPDTPAQLEADIQKYARELAIDASPVGRDAARLYTLAAELRDALDLFDRHYEDDDNLRQHASRVLAAAGLEEGPGYGLFNRNHFDGMIDAVRGWHFLLSIMADLLSQYEPPRRRPMPE